MSTRIFRRVVAVEVVEPSEAFGRRPGQLHAVGRRLRDHWTALWSYLTAPLTGILMAAGRAR